MRISIKPEHIKVDDRLEIKDIDTGIWNKDLISEYKESGYFVICKVIPDDIGTTLLFCRPHELDSAKSSRVCRWGINSITPNILFSRIVPDSPIYARPRLDLVETD